MIKANAATKITLRALIAVTLWLLAVFFLQQLRNKYFDGAILGLVFYYGVFAYLSYLSFHFINGKLVFAIPKFRMRHGLGGLCLATLISLLALNTNLFDATLYHYAFDPKLTLQLLIITLCIALGEEVLFRFAVQNTLTALLGKYAGSALQIILFAAIHAPWASSTPLLMWASFLSFSLIASLLTKTGLGLLGSIGYHAGYDWMAFYFFGSGSEFSAITNWEQIFGMFDHALTMRQRNVVVYYQIGMELLIAAMIVWRLYSQKTKEDLRP
jgi:membrane protease YdiL (CAAX protease family)